ncbi:putative aldo/keto reductase [Bradyrhizobium sp. ORS 278]|uniref:aldo/keto reductase n=1 Tax=Bradyrhizobium sp. (strain ORS 278) TaxID=114615 RepID=UPI0001507C2C|nr:aldo/keto reductase [Bradyrhizobium sp. ORS 278]CAL76047.1 putative aldo/keto reductase [Bradyrhizobium sp. ORS 278]
MRTVQIPQLDRQVSALGFGCASLGSRISPAAGGRAIARALELGVTWFDVAPAYGDGNAEALLGEALRDARKNVVICTKFGIEPPQVGLTARLLRPLARSAVAAFPRLRLAASRARPIGTRAPIDPDRVDASVIRSLRRLKTDYIDVLALHEPSLEDVSNPAIHDVLRRLLKRGIIRAVGIAGDPLVMIAAKRSGLPIGIAQFPDSPFSDAAGQVRRHLQGTASLVTHGVFGSGVVDRLAALDGAQRTRLAKTAKLQGSPVKSNNDLLLRFAFANNPDGVVVMSQFDARHIAINVAAAAQCPVPQLADSIRAALASEESEVAAAV